MDDSGNILAVWLQSDGEFTNLWSARFDHSTLTWSPAAKLEEAPFDVLQSAVAMNSSGVATTIWVQPDNTLWHVYGNRTTLAPAGAQPSITGQGSPTVAATFVSPGSPLVTSSFHGNSLPESTAKAPAVGLASGRPLLGRLDDKPSKSVPATLRVSAVDEAFGQLDLLDDLLGLADQLQP